jgi:hypothetical protein
MIEDKNLSIRRAPSPYSPPIPNPAFITSENTNIPFAFPDSSFSPPVRLKDMAIEKIIIKVYI